MDMPVFVVILKFTSILDCVPYRPHSSDTQVVYKLQLAEYQNGVKIPKETVWCNEEEVCYSLEGMHMLNIFLKAREKSMNSLKLSSY